MTEKTVLVPDASHPITVTPTAGRVVVKHGDTTVAESTGALTLQESDYPAVQYIPLADVDAKVLRPSDHSTYCPYKGDAAYYDLQVDSEVADNAVWTYQRPYDSVAPIAGHVAFYPGVVDVQVL